MAAGLSLRDLPADVIIVILRHLPIADAVRTSILSRSWRHQWRSIPDLAFNLHNDLDMVAVDQVLGLHSTPIQSFSLYAGYYQLNSNDLDRWLAVLSADPLSLQSLTLDVFGLCVDPQPSIANTLLFSFSNLNHLYLVGCSLPMYYYGLVGFPVLETLHLSCCILPDDDSSSISSLISGCPLLQKLTLLTMNCIHLRICAPNLRSFVFEGGLEGFELASAPLLTTVVISLHHFYCDDKEELNSCNLIKAFGNVRSIKKLNLLGYSLCFLENFEIPDRILDSFERLKVLTLTVDFSNAKETLVLLCLLRSAPNLHEINIEALKSGQKFQRLGHEFWQAQNHLELPKLQTLKLTHISSVESMLEFIDFILPKAQELKKMEINISPGIEKYGSINKLSRFEVLVLRWRASTRAQIILRADSLVWISSASREGFSELRDHIVSKLEDIEYQVQELESKQWDRVEELHCQIRGEYLPECVIRSSESDVGSSVWIKSALWEEFSRLRHYVESILCGFIDRYQKIETELKVRKDEDCARYLAALVQMIVS